jgi:hypothetical protein
MPMNRHDVDACAAVYAEDTTNHGHQVGRAGLRTVLADIFRTFPDWHTTIDDLETMQQIGLWPPA